jgi:hypothetical protein
MIPCRFARHTLPDGSNHIDLFIDLDGQSELQTFEIAPAYLIKLRSYLGEEKQPIFIITDFSDAEEAIPLIEKKPHRRIYLEYEGIIEPYCGKLIHLGYGLLEKISKNSRFLLQK